MLRIIFMIPLTFCLKTSRPLIHYTSGRTSCGVCVCAHDPPPSAKTGPEFVFDMWNWDLEKKEKMYEWESSNVVSEVTFCRFSVKLNSTLVCPLVDYYFSNKEIHISYCIKLCEATWNISRSNVFGAHSIWRSMDFYSKEYLLIRQFMYIAVRTEEKQFVIVENPTLTFSLFVSCLKSEPDYQVFTALYNSQYNL